MPPAEYAIEQSHPGNLRDLFTVLFRHQLKILAVFLTVVAMVTMGTFLVSPTYEAKSSVLVKIGREYMYRPEIADKAPIVSVSQEEAVNSEINIMSSRDLIEKVITNIGVSTIYPKLQIPSGASPLEAAIITFTKNLKVEVIKKTNVLQVSFRHQDARIAAQAVNLLVDRFKEKHLQVYNGPESAFVGNQLKSFEQKLKVSEDELQHFKQQRGVFSLDEQRALLLKQHMELDQALKNAHSQVESLKRRVSSLNTRIKQMASASDRYTQTERDKIIVDAKAQLLNLQLKEREYRLKYSEGSRLVVNVRKEIAMVSDFLKQQEEDIVRKVNTGNVVYQEAEKQAVVAEADLSAELAKEKTLQQQLNQLNGTIKRLDLDEKELEILKRDIATNDKNYRTYVERFEEARISDDKNRQQLANLTVIEAATPPASPVKPNKLLNVVLGILVGAASGIGCAFFSEYTSQGFPTAESAEKRLGLPVLATVTLRK